jgi:hypothetical protein
MAERLGRCRHWALGRYGRGTTGQHRLAGSSQKIKARLVIEREFESICLEAEDVAEFDYQPTHCDRPYRMVVTRKNLTVSRGEKQIPSNMSSSERSTKSSIRFAADPTTGGSRDTDVPVTHGAGLRRKRCLIKRQRWMNGSESLSSRRDTLSQHPRPALPAKGVRIRLF